MTEDGRGASICSSAPLWTCTVATDDSRNVLVAVLRIDATSVHVPGGSPRPVSDQPEFVNRLP